jgi:crotonobetainyl-CoA:carnitine CoA-transferase CaiB-like acyl-CoA transferase
MNAMTLQALGDLRVVETTVGISGAYCTKLFCDAGAEVIKVERGGGDPLRRYAATAPVPDGEDGALFGYLNAGKRSVRAADGISVPDDLLAGADLWIQDLLLPGVDIAGVRSRHPQLVVVSITPYGTTGPYAGRPASDLTVQAESGALLFKGRPDRPPVQAGGRIVEFLGGLFAAAPALAAAMRARREGVGEYIDLSLLEVMAISGSNFTDLYHQMLGQPEWDAPWRYVDTPGIERAADGLVAFNANTAQMFESFLLLVGRPDLIGDRTYSGLKSRLALGDDWQVIIDTFVGQLPVGELINLATDLRIPAAPVHDGSSVVADEHLASRGVFLDGGNGVLEPRPPYLLSQPSAATKGLLLTSPAS